MLSNNPAHRVTVATVVVVHVYITCIEVHVPCVVCVRLIARGRPDVAPRAYVVTTTIVAIASRDSAVIYTVFP